MRQRRVARRSRGDPLRRPIAPAVSVRYNVFFRHFARSLAGTQRQRPRCGCSSPSFSRAEARRRYSSCPFIERKTAEERPGRVADAAGANERPARTLGRIHARRRCPIGTRPSRLFRTGYEESHRPPSARRTRHFDAEVKRPGRRRSHIDSVESLRTIRRKHRARVATQMRRSLEVN